jgi:hypothetical protein
VSLFSVVFFLSFFFANVVSFEKPAAPAPERIRHTPLVAAKFFLFGGGVPAAHSKKKT